MTTRGLNKCLAHAGVCSRREADRWIAEGRVSVNGAVVMELGEKIDPERDKVLANGRPVRAEAERPVYILLNKPAGRVVSVKDPFGRPTVMELLSHVPARVYPVGRLDLDTEGALLLTNDGELALRLTHPRYGVAKVYEVRVEGEPDDADLDKVRKGIFLEGPPDGSPARVQVVRRGHRHATLKVEIHEGRQAGDPQDVRGRRLPGRRPRPDSISPGLTLEGLRSGQWRYLHTGRDPAAEEARRPGPAAQRPASYFDPSGVSLALVAGAHVGLQPLGQPLELPVDQAVDRALRDIRRRRRRPRPRRPVRISMPSSIVRTG
ncbi:MAG: rRNA pseudouridine synthase [Candidatus Moduliflexus flocculans]|nr:rRNA pseudouridine synthase [Candidatus Moduliflexus flocculans]